MLTPLINITRFRAVLFCIVLASFELLTYIASDIIMPAMLSVTHDLGASPITFPTRLISTCSEGSPCNG